MDNHNSPFVSTSLKLFRNQRGSAGHSTSPFIIRHWKAEVFFAGAIAGFLLLVF